MSPEPNPAPADTRPRAPWPTWRKVLAYVILAAAAAFGIWLVDVKSKLGETREPRAGHATEAHVLRIDRT
jgi:hypothetical protein